MSIYNRERIQFSAFISNMRSFMAAYDLIQGKLRLYWERTCRIILLDSSLTRLMMSIDNRERLNFSTFISNMPSFMAAYDLIQV